MQRLARQAERGRAAVHRVGDQRMTARGHPLVADAVYGGAPALGLARQALHAWRLAFAHPSTGASMAFEAAPPADFAAAWEQIA